MSKKFTPNINTKFYKSQMFQDKNLPNETSIYKITKLKVQKLQNMESNICNSINTVENQDTDVINDFQQVFHNSNITQKPQSSSSVKQIPPSQFRNVFENQKQMPNNKNIQSTKNITQNDIKLDQPQRKSFSNIKNQKNLNFQVKQKQNSSNQLFKQVIPKINNSLENYEHQSIQQSVQQKQFSITEFQKLRDQQLIPQKNQIVQIQKQLFEVQQKFSKQRQSLFRQKMVLQRQVALKDSRIEMLEKIISSKQQENHQSLNISKNLNTTKEFMKRKNAANNGTFPKRQSFQPISHFQRVIKDRQIKINQLLIKIQEMNNKINEKNTIINQLIFDKIKLQSIIESMTNKIFILEHKDTDNIFLSKNKNKKVVFQNSLSNNKLYSPKKTDLNQTKSFNIIKNLEKRNTYQDTVDKRLQILKNNRVQIKQKQKQKKAKTKTFNNTFHASTTRQFFKTFKSPTNRNPEQCTQSPIQKSKDLDIVDQTNNKYLTYIQ